MEGGAGATDLAREVMASASGGSAYKPLYDLDIPVFEKVRTVCRGMYGADDVAFTKEAEKDLRRIEELGLDGLPICIAKAPSSLSDDPLLHGRPRDFQVTVRNLQVNSGAGFLVVLTGDIMRMPGLPRQPLAQRVKFKPDGTIEGIG
jgi:formate--tetrahydrofolate ligase